MNRTVRNGLAVATMAGGMWLLGTAVASADTGTSASSESTGPAVTATDSSTNAEGDLSGHDVYNDGNFTAGAGNTGGSVSGTTASSHVDGGSGGGSTTASSSATNTITNTSPGGAGGSADFNPTTDGAVEGGTASANGGGDVHATSESTGGGGSTELPPVYDLAATSTSGSSSGAGAATEVNNSTTAVGVVSGHQVSNDGDFHAGNGAPGGSVNGTTATSYTICITWKADNHCTSSATNTISNTSPGGAGGSANFNPSTHGNVSGGTASANGGGSVTASSESADFEDFLSWLLGSGYAGSSGDGAYTVVDSSTNAVGSAGGHLVTNHGDFYAGNGGAGGSVNNTTATSYVICITWKGDNHCGSTATNTITNTSPGGAGGSANFAPVTSGNVSGGNACASSSGTPCPDATQPTHPAQPDTTAPVQYVAPVQHVAPVATGSGSHATTVSASHSSPATLAYTGADVSDALGLGLVALVGGLGLALAGRRRTAA